MEFRVLGPLEVWDDAGAAVPVRGAEERALLLALLLAANETVPLGRLIDAAWPAGPPPAAAALVRERLSALGRMLDRGEAAATSRLVALADGWRLRAGHGEVDRSRFEALVEEAHAHPDPAAALALHRMALDLWRGPPLEEVADRDFAGAEIARLDALRLASLEARVGLELRSGRHDNDLVAELLALAAAHPLRQELHRQLMLALYRAGRDAEALAVAQELRRSLARELGIEPDAALRQLELAIFRRDVPPEPEAEPAPDRGRAAPQPEAHAAVGRRGEAQDLRKTVTIVFTDLVDSSRLSLALDPEALRSLLSRYFGELSAIVERHGGIVEKYIGDAIMAVFGVPAVHEDDALRAVRAAVEMRDALVGMNRDIEATWGVRLASRIGVNTGEVVAGDHRQGDFFVTGQAVTAPSGWKRRRRRTRS